MTKKPLTIHLTQSRTTGNFWIDMGLAVLLQHFGEGERSIQDVQKWLLSRLVRPTGNKGEYYDGATGTIREYEKQNWDYPTNLFIKVSGRAPKIRIGGKEYFTQPPEFGLSLKLDKKLSMCDVCADIAPLTDATMWMYPFVVDPSKFGTFYPGTKRGLRVCARCALAGLAGYLGWLWRAQGRDALHFFVFHSDLPELLRLRSEVLEPLKLEGNKRGNAPVAFSGPYLHETVLGLLLALFVHVRKSDRLSEEGRRLLAAILGAKGEGFSAPLTLYAITGKPGQAFNMQALREFSRLQRFYLLYNGWIRQLVTYYENPHQRLELIFRQFRTQQGQNRESIWRDRIAWAVLEFGDPLPSIEQFLYEARAREQRPAPLVGGTMEVFRYYLQEVMGMDEQFQRMLAGFGHTLGATAQQQNEMGLLYAIRNSKNPEDFYRVLNDVQFRLQITIPEALLRIEKGERIAGVPWARVKTLLSIYAMNAYLRKIAPEREEATPTVEEE